MPACPHGVCVGFKLQRDVLSRQHLRSRIALLYYFSHAGGDSAEARDAGPPCTGSHWVLSACHGQYAYVGMLALFTKVHTTRLPRMLSCIGCALTFSRKGIDLRHTVVHQHSTIHGCWHAQACMDAVRWLEVRVKDDPDKLSDRSVVASAVLKKCPCSNAEVSVHPKMYGNDPALSTMPASLLCQTVTASCGHELAPAAEKQYSCSLTRVSRV